MLRLLLIIWYLLVSLGVYEAARGVMFSQPKALACAIGWPVLLPVIGLICLGLEIADRIRDHWPF